ncbi:MAG TPA: hypothetical protein VGF59_20555 [Bryobacteraceae bacterium]|jgi:hypothetical protein
MKLTLTLLALAGLPAFGQLQGTKAPAKAAPATVASASTTSGGAGSQKSRPARSTIAGLEKAFDEGLATADAKDPFDILGTTRGIYLDGYGTVFTTEVSLIVTPGISAFKPKFSDAEKAAIKQRKQAHLAVLKALMTEMLRVSANTLNTAPAGDKIVLSVRLQYYPWEDTTAMPTQIVMTADRQSAMAGKVQTEEQ